MAAAWCCQSCGAEVRHVKAPTGETIEVSAYGYVLRSEPWPAGIFVLTEGCAAVAEEPVFRGTIGDGPLWELHSAACVSVPAAA